MKKFIEKVKGNKELVALMIVAIILIVVGIFMAVGHDNLDNNKVNGTHVEPAMTKEEATNMIKELFHGNNYEFSCEDIPGGNYKITVVNALSGNIYYYFVDTKTKTYVFQAD